MLGWCPKNDFYLCRRKFTVGIFVRFSETYEYHWTSSDKFPAGVVKTAICTSKTSFWRKTSEKNEI